MGAKSAREAGPKQLDRSITHLKRPFSLVLMGLGVGLMEDEADTERFGVGGFTVMLDIPLLELTKEPSSLVIVTRTPVLAAGSIRWRHETRSAHFGREWEKVAMNSLTAGQTVFEGAVRPLSAAVALFISGGW
jgi:hypothetical protein